MINRNRIPATASCQSWPMSQISCCLCAGSLYRKYEDKFIDELRGRILLEPTLLAEHVPAGSNSKAPSDDKPIFISKAQLSNHTEALRSRDVLDTAPSNFDRREISKVPVSNNLSFRKSMTKRLKRISSSRAMHRTIKVLLENFIVHNTQSVQSQLEILGQNPISQQPLDCLNDLNILYDINSPLLSQSKLLRVVSAYLLKTFIGTWKTETGLDRNLQTSSAFPCFSNSLKRRLVQKTNSMVRRFAVHLLKKALSNSS